MEQLHEKKFRKKKKQPKLSAEQLARISAVSDSIRERMREATESRKKSLKKPISKKWGDQDSILAKTRHALARAHLSNPLNAMRPFKVTLTESAVSAIVSASGGVGYARNIQLDELPGYADYVALFDQYRITKVCAHFIPRCNTNNLTVVSSASTATLSPIAVTWDPDDSTTPSGADEVLQYPTCKVHPGYQVFEYTWKPRAAVAAYGGAFTQFADFDGWIDCASDDVEWYAIKAWQFGSGVSQTTFQIWDIFFVTEIEFRFVR